MDTPKPDLPTVPPEPCCAPGDACCCGPAPATPARRVKNALVLVLIAVAVAVAVLALVAAPAEAPAPAAPPAAGAPAR